MNIKEYANHYERTINKDWPNTEFEYCSQHFEAGFALGMELAEWADMKEWTQIEKGQWEKHNVIKTTTQLTELFIESKMKEK